MSESIGFYGKLPDAGGFVQQHLCSAFVAAWDRHFQRAVETARHELGEQWCAAWERGEAWRFVLSPGVCGSSAWCGLTGPSVDCLGRGFPMVLAAPCVGEIGNILRDAAWFDSLERVYLAARHDTVSVESFAAQVASLPRLRSGTTDVAAVLGVPDGEGEEGRTSLPHGGAMVMLLADLWRQSAMQGGTRCLWWTRGASRMLATWGLPNSYASLLAPLSADMQVG